MRIMSLLSRRLLQATLVGSVVLSSVANAGGSRCEALVRSIALPVSSIPNNNRRSEPAIRTEAPAVETKDPSKLTEADITREIEEQDAALWKIGVQHFYERAINFLQKHVTVSSVRSGLAKQRSRKLNLIHFLNEGKSNEATDIFRKQFDDVELSFWLIKTFRSQLEVLPEGSMTRMRLNRRLKMSEFKFSQNYGEYIAIRSYLDGVNETTSRKPLFVETAQKTLRNLGAHKFSEIYPEYASLHIPEERPALADIKALFRSSTHYTRLKLWSDFKGEIFSALRYFVSSEVIIGALDSVINRFPPVTSDKLKSLSGLMRSAQMRQRNLPQLVEIESLPNDANLRLEELRQKNTLTKNDELLVTYARTVEFTDSFNEIKEAARNRAKNPDDNIHRDFYERMLQAEQRAFNLPDISLYERMSNIDVMYTLIQCGIIIKVAGPHVFHSSAEFFNFLLGVPFFGQ